MLREIIVPDKNTYLLKLPDNYIGKSLEIIAFEINEPSFPIVKLSKEARLKQIEAITSKSLVDLTNYTFNRDEANDYDK
jgi:hypothetical protein